MSKTRVYLLAVLGVAAAVAFSLPAAGSSAPTRTAQEIFGIPLVIPCTFSHRNRDDPIVYPRKKGLSHDHTFFGNRSTNAFSTAASLRRSLRSTCGQVADRAAYWTPTLFVGKRAVVPTVMVATYTRRTSALVKPLPAGLKMVAGDANARNAQSTEHVYWACVADPDRRFSTIPTCPASRRGLQLNVRFPDCWDGKRVDSFNHFSHMDYSSEGKCPDTNPVAVPTISLQITYPVTGGPKAMLSSGRFGTHADFFNGWDQGTFAGLVNLYFNREM
jgi:Domain of unknown function (DUF1996)